MTDDQLQPFCSTDESRPILTAPFSWEDHTYATDGRIVIRVPRIEEAEPESDVSQALFGEIKTGPTWYALPGELAIPDEPEPVPCKECKGKPSQVCSDCEGTASVEWEYSAIVGMHYKEADCPVCDGDGGGCICEGTGLEETKTVRVRVGDVEFAAHYLRMIAELPECRIAPTDEFQPAPFRFNGGEGLLMPLRSE